jgi:hypothetical protein
MRVNNFVKFKEINMKFLNTAVVVSAIAISSFSVNAEQLIVSGITWDSSYVSPTHTQNDDFFAAGTYAQTVTASATVGLNDLSGTGLISIVNGTTADVFCIIAGCTLSYSFDGFTVDPINNAVDSTLGTLAFTVTDTNGTNLWLSLVAQNGGSSYIGTTGDYFNSFTGFFDVLELAGTAWKNFDTNTQAGGTDFEMIGVTANLHTSVFKSNSVPAPTTLAIFGLALLGLAGVRRKL